MRRIVARAFGPWAIVVLGALGPTGCARPIVAKDGTVVVQQEGARGASVLTANGIEYHDGTDMPAPVVVRDPREPWKAPTGFILPASGRFTKTSAPTVLAREGIRIVLRPSDTRVPSWGGEVLVRVDVAVPAAPERVRDPVALALVLDGYGPDVPDLALAALGQLGSEDRLTVVDGRGGRVLVPSLPAENRSLALAATDRRAAKRAPGTPDLARALRLAREALEGKASSPEGASPERTRIVVVLSEVGDRGLPRDAAAEVRKLAEAGIVVHALAAAPGVDLGRLEAIASPTGGIASADVTVDARAAWVRSAVPPPGKVVYKSVGVTFESSPAPSHVLEASGGEVYWRLDAGELGLGDLREGEARTDVVRVSVPPWTPGEEFTFRVTARAHDAAGRVHEFSAALPCVYDDNLGRLADSRHGDVIAYASALATLRRLEAAFAGDAVRRRGGLRRIAAMHARSMAFLGRDTGDVSVRKQAEMLEALLRATED